MKEMVLYPEKWGLDLDVAKRVLDKGANFSVEFCQVTSAWRPSEPRRFRTG